MFQQLNNSILQSWRNQLPRLPAFFCKNNGKKAFSEFKLVIPPTL